MYLGDRLTDRLYVPAVYCVKRSFGFRVRLKCLFVSGKGREFVCQRVALLVR